MKKKVAVIVLWIATFATVIAHAQQAAYALQNGTQGVSVGAEFQNLLVSVALLLYAAHLKDRNLVAARVLIVIGWAVRWLAVAL